jgi:small subunit ribosomal protein S1
MMAKVEEKLPFKVIEFNKSAKKIIVSHSRVYEDEKKAAEAPETKAESAPRKASRKQKSSSEKTTLGDISQLAALKEEMEEKENKASGKKRE